MIDRSIFRIAWRLLNEQFEPGDDTYQGVAKDIHNAALEAGWLPPDDSPWPLVDLLTPAMGRLLLAAFDLQDKDDELSAACEEMLAAIRSAQHIVWAPRSDHHDAATSIGKGRPATQ